MNKSKKTPKILITVPSLNLLEYCQKLIPTIKSKHKFYLLLIDNHSKDKTAKYFQKLSKQSNVFAGIMHENMGVAGSWNIAASFGFENLGCKYVVFLNNDTLLTPDTIDVLIKDLKRPRVALASARNVADECIDERDFFKRYKSRQGKIKDTPDFSCFGINKKCFKKVGLFDEAFFPAYFEDNDYHHRIKLEGLRGVCDVDNYYFHYGSRTRQKDDRFDAYIKYRYTKNQDYYAIKWGGKPGSETNTEPFNGIPPKRISIEQFPE